MEMMDYWLNYIKTIISGSTSNNIARAVLLLTLSGMVFFFRRWVASQKRKAADAITRRDRINRRTQIDADTRDIDEDINNSEDELEDRLND